MAPERGPQLQERVERQDHLLSPHLQAPGRKLFEDFEVLAGEGRGARDVAGRRRIELLQDGQHFETDAVAGVLAGQVRGVRTIGLVQVSPGNPGSPARALDKGTLDLAPHGRDAGEPAQPGAPRQVHKHGLGHVVGGVTGGDDLEAHAGGHLFGEPVPLVTRPLLEVGTTVETETPHLAGHVQPATQLADELRVLVGLFAAQTVVHVQHHRFAAEGDDYPQQRHRVRAAGDERKRATEVHAVTLRRPPHHIRETRGVHTDSQSSSAERRDFGVEGIQAKGTGFGRMKGPW